MTSGPRRQDESYEQYRERLDLEENLARLKRTGKTTPRRLERMREIIGKRTENALSKKEPEKR